MKIFLSNDDGIDSNGLISLAKQLSKDNDMLIVAPDGNRSVCSHSLTVKKPITISPCDKLFGQPMYKTSGTPADCVKILEHHFTDFKPDVVVSGINKAHNLGSDIFYSGTVAIAYEAAYYGYIAFAFSAYSLGESPFDEYSPYAEKIINALLPYSEPSTIWNVNFPDVDVNIKDIKITKLGNRTYDDKYVFVCDDNYQLTSTDIKFDDKSLQIEEDYDLYWIKNGYITVTPLVFDRTDYAKLEEIIDKCIKF